MEPITLAAAIGLAYFSSSVILETPPITEPPANALAAETRLVEEPATAPAARDARRIGTVSPSWSVGVYR